MPSKSKGKLIYVLDFIRVKGRIVMPDLGLNARKIVYLSGKIKTCQRPANGANNMPTVPFMYVQKFGTKFSTLGAN
jgi:hypothetical protein